VLFGGAMDTRGTMILGDTWTWDGTTWTQLTLATSPSARWGAAGTGGSGGLPMLIFGGTVGNATTSQFAGDVIDTWAYGTLPPVRLNAVVSRKVQGTAGTFDINLPLTGTRGIECRSGGSTNDYTLVFTFTNNLTSVASASVTGHDPTSGTGTVLNSSLGPNPNQYTVNLTGVPNAQYLTVTLTGAVDSTGATGNVSGTMGVLLGDVNASGIVTSGDTNLCKAQALQPVTNANFRNDINASGAITTGDVNLIKQNALSQLPSPP
jgi:hypothetical protein